MIELKNLVKTYQKPGEVPVKAIDNISLDIQGGEFVAILGPSGSGKSTLMNIMGLLDRPDSGSYFLNGQNVFEQSDDELARIRNKTIGFVFQSFHLLPRTTAIENVQLPLLYSTHKDFEAKSRTALEAVGLRDRMNHFTHELSGGQQQRVAIARALVNNPEIIFADEPTGNLDSSSENEILELFKSLNSDGRTIVFITHNLDIAAQAERIIKVRDGKIESDIANIATV